jgi:hypothetical protein
MVAGPRFFGMTFDIININRHFESCTAARRKVTGKRDHGLQGY